MIPPPLRRFFRSGSTRSRLARNVTYLFSANVIVAAVGLVTLAVTARALGPGGLGAVALIEAFVRAVSRCVQIEPWQAIVRYGAHSIERGARAEFLRLVKLGLVIDMAGSLLGAATAIGLAQMAGPLLGLDAAHTAQVSVCALMLLASFSSPMAVLRLLDRFDLIARVSVGFALSRLALATAAWAFGGEVWAFLIVLMVSSVIEGLVPLWLALRTLRNQGYSGLWSTPLTGVRSEHPGLVRFIFNSNISLIARDSTQRFDSLIVGGLLGATAVGYFQIAKKVGLAALRFGRPLQQIVYPEIARIWARGDVRRFRRVVLGVNALLGLGSLAAVLLLAPMVEPILVATTGPGFAAATMVVTVQLAASAVFLGGLTLNSALLTVGWDRALMWFSLMSTLAFFGALPILTLWVGVVGASFSHLLYNLLLRLGQALMFRRATRAHIEGEPKPLPAEGRHAGEAEGLSEPCAEARAAPPEPRLERA